MYISIHTYGNKIIYPYGYTTKEHPRRAKLHEIAQAGANAVFDATGTVFIPDQSGSLLYVSGKYRINSHEEYFNILLSLLWKTQLVVSELFRSNKIDLDCLPFA